MSQLLLQSPDLLNSVVLLELGLLHSKQSADRAFHIEKDIHLRFDKGKYRFIQITLTHLDVGATSCAVFCIGGAFECEISLVFLCTDGSCQLHDCTTISTNEFLAIDIHCFWQMIVLAGICFRAFHGFFVDLLDFLKQLITDDRIVRVFRYNPLILGGNVIRDATVKALTALLLSEMTNIYNVIQYLRNLVLVPKDRPVFTIVVGYDAAVKLLLTGGWDSGIIELLVDAHITNSGSSPLENLLDNRCCFRINKQVVFVLRISAIAIGSIISDIVTALHFRLQCRSDFS